MDLVKKTREMPKIMREVEICLIELYKRIEYDLYNIVESKAEYATNAHEALPMFITSLELFPHLKEKFVKLADSVGDLAYQKG